MARLPEPGESDWGEILNEFLLVEHSADGTLRTSGTLASTRITNALQHGEVLINAKDYGAVGNGTADDTAAIRSAVAAAATSLGTVLLTGNHFVTGTITIPEGVVVQGAGGIVKVSVAAGCNFAVFRIDGTRGEVRDLRIVKASGAVAGANGYGVLVAGNSTGVRIANVTADGMSVGFIASGILGTVAGTVKQVVFERCRALNSNVFGFQADDTNGLELVHCSSTVSGLDGAKLRKKTYNVTVTGGYYTGAVAGDGMDCFAGGDTFTIQGTVFADNGHNGLVVKNDTLTRDDPASYGYVRAVNVTGLIATGNKGSGIACHRGSGNDTTISLVNGVNFSSCQLNGNGNYGLYLNARNVTVSGITARRNGMDGIYLEPACRDVDLIGCHVAGNSIGNPYTAVSSRDGFHIDGRRIRIIGGSSNGSDPDIVLNDADMAAGTKKQRYGLRVEVAATDVDVFGFNAFNNITADVNDLSAGIRKPGPSTGVNYLDAGKYVVPEGVRSTLTLAASVENAVPIWLGNGGTVVRIGCEVITAGSTGSRIVLGLRSSLNHSPGVVIGQATVAGDAIASVEATVSFAVPSAGLYWLTATAQNTGYRLPVIRATTGNLAPVCSASLATAMSASALAGYQTAATVTGALPGTYTVSGKLATAPLIAIRV
jgi:hypothetical protein